jgi:hypothetical protein
VPTKDTCASAGAFCLGRAVDAGTFSAVISEPDSSASQASEVAVSSDRVLAVSQQISGGVPGRVPVLEICAVCVPVVEICNSHGP